MPERIILRNTQSPGDYIVLSAALRDISRAHPGRFEFMMDVPQQAVFQHNPYTKQYPKSVGRQVVAKYPLIHKSNQVKVHFLWGFIEYLNQQLSTKAVLTEFRPDLYLTAEEKQTAPAGVKRPYWVFASGGKKDFTAKWWDPTWWQLVVNSMKDRVTLVQVGGGSHVHPRLTNVHDLVGKTSFRDLMRLIYHSEGTLCVVTCLMHIAAAFNKPCVVVAGGREPWCWEAYNLEGRLINMRRGIPDWQPPKNDTFIPHQYLHTDELLDCCRGGKGCWKSKIEGSGSVCRIPARQNGCVIPKCLQLITPDKVLDAVNWYYKEGILTWGKVSLAVPLTVAWKEAAPYREPFLTRNLAEAFGAARKDEVIVWLAKDWHLKDGWEGKLVSRLSENVIAGLIYSERPVDGSAKRSYYSKGMIAASQAALKKLKMPDVADPNFQKLFGKAVRESGIKWVDMGDLLRF